MTNKNGEKLFLFSTHPFPNYTSRLSFYVVITKFLVECLPADMKHFDGL